MSIISSMNAKITPVPHSVTPRGCGTSFGKVGTRADDLYFFAGLDSCFVLVITDLIFWIVFSLILHVDLGAFIITALLDSFLCGIIQTCYERT